jgi:hypothetical protein
LPPDSPPSFLSARVLGGTGVGGGGVGCLASLSPSLELELEDMIQSIDTIKHNNADFAYEYTQKTLEKVNKSLDVVNTKLSGALAFSGVLLKFTESLDSNGILGFIKIGICFCCAGCIISCGLGLSPNKTGNVVAPDSFLEPEIYRLSDEECKLFTMRQTIIAIAQIDILLKERCEHLNVAIVLIVLSGLGIAISIGAQKWLEIS